MLAAELRVIYLEIATERYLQSIYGTSRFIKRKCVSVKDVYHETLLSGIPARDGLVDETSLLINLGYLRGRFRRIQYGGPAWRIWFMQSQTTDRPIFQSNISRLLWPGPHPPSSTVFFQANSSQCPR